MFRILKCDKDAYITNKIIRNANSVASRSVGSNTGQAGTIDMFKLYNETPVSGGSGIEITRAFLHFDLSPLLAITASKLDVSDVSFKCYLQLFDVYGGQTTPSNFTLSLFPLAKTFVEGRGSDVIGYQDVDSVNWITASVVGGVVTPWTITGSLASGSVGASGIDYYLSGGASLGNASLERTQTFSRGDEDLSIDVTTLVSATIAGIIPDYGYRLSFVDSEERDTTTRFVKRFTSRHSRNNFQHPRLIVKYNDSFIDNQLMSTLDSPNTIGVYNTYFGDYHNFTSGGIAATGSNSVVLELHSSKSILYSTSSWSQTHSQSITYLTSAFSYFSTSFSGSQLMVGNNPQTGIYFSDVFLSSSDANLSAYMGTDKQLEALALWKSADGAVLYTSGAYLTFHRIAASSDNVTERNFIVNIQNLKTVYLQQEIARFRVFVQNYNTDLRVYYLPVDPMSEIYKTSHWRVVHAFTREIIIPFDLTGNSTLMSADGRGMYFDFYMSDLEINQVYELEFLIRENGQDYITTNQGFKFKVSA